MAELHPLCASLAPLLGTWRGSGAGDYPTIDDFAYAEELTFGHCGKPFLAVAQRTRRFGTGDPLHSESGYLRAFPDGALEFVIAQSIGVVEVNVGSFAETVDGLVIEVGSAEVGLAPTAKSVTAVRRRLSLSGSILTTDLWMAAVGEPDLVHHLRSELSR